ncbi:MAG: hypothetical protein KBT46_08695 [Ruminococcus sp.]|nr:hypothetical protein [Candidatus Copronaster equi]
MKKFFCLLFVTVILFGFCSCTEQTTAILDNSGKSSFVDFYEENDVVCIECVLNVYNPDKKEKDVRITAVDNEDVDVGLLQSPELTAVNKNDGEERFTLKPGENQLNVIFKGKYSGVYQITAREIPRFIIIENA